MIHGHEGTMIPTACDTGRITLAPRLGRYVLGEAAVAQCVCRLRTAWHNSEGLKKTNPAVVGPRMSA